MKTKKVFMLVIFFSILIIMSLLVFAEDSKQASDFQSNGDLIEGWYWLRDSALQDYAEWTFDNIPLGPKEITVKINALATDQPSGGKGFDAKFLLYYSPKGEGPIPLTFFPPQTVTLKNVSSPDDPLGYNCQGQVTIPASSYPGGSRISLRIRRESAQDNHVAFKKDSIVLLTGVTSSFDGDRLPDTDELDEAILIQPGTYTGSLGEEDNEGHRDNRDYYSINLVDGQLITLKLTVPENANYRISLLNTKQSSRGSTITQKESKILDYVADSTGTWYIKITRSSGEGEYQLSIDIQNQNDAGSGHDAGKSTQEAIPVSPGIITGFLKVGDNRDYYSIDLVEGQQITLKLTIPENANYRIVLSFPKKLDGCSSDRDDQGNIKILKYVVGKPGTGTWYINVYRSSGEGYYQLSVDTMALSNQGRTLTSNLPIFVKEDEVGNTKIDSDGDGIVQEWEDAAIEYINPYIELDKKEPWLTRQDTDHVANFVRVHPYPDFYYVSDFSYHSMHLPQYVIFRYLVTWSKDYGRQSIGDYDIDIFTGHSGDHERIFMAWKVIDNKTLRLEWVFTSSHKDPDVHHAVWNALHRTCNKGDVAYWPPTEFYHTEVFCGKLKFSQNNRLIICASEGKHALYPSCDICENVMLVDLLGPVNIGEDCCGGGRFRFVCYNVGEPGGWTIQDKDVYDLTVEGTYDLNDGKLGGPLPNIFENKLTCRYGIQIKTGNKKLAGTDAKLSIKLFGSEGSSQWFEVYAKPVPPRYGSADRIGTFEKGDTDNIYINSPDLGEVNKIQIKHDNSGDGPGWYISEIWVEDLETNTMWHSQPNTWLDRGIFSDNTNKTFNLELE